MRIVVIGQAAFGAEVIEKLVQRGEEVVGAFCPKGGRGDRVKQVADKLAITVWQTTTMKSADVFSHFSQLRPDLAVMAFVTDMVPAGILNCPRLGTIQYHPSLLPRHRGGSAINWAMIQGDTKTGISIFWPDEGIDTGPILLQKAVDIAPDDTMGSLYFNKLYPIGVTLMLEAVDSVKRGKAPQTAQDESRATHEGLFGDNEAKIDWGQPAARVYDLVRGTNPQPGAHTLIGGCKVRILDSRLVTTPTEGLPGQILEVSDHGLTIAASGGAIRVERVQPESAAKTEAVTYAKAVGLTVGARIGM